MATVGIVGHRFFTQAHTAKFIFDRSIVLLKEITSKKNNVLAFSALAQGADSIFAEAAISLDIPLKIVTPFTGYETDFNAPDKLQYRYLKNKAIHEIKQPYKRRTTHAYFAAMKIIVDQSDVVVAAWNGSFAGGRGGTADAVKRVLQKRQSWIHLDVERSEVYFYLND